MTEGEIDKYKAQLVVQGFRQKFGVDYEETFPPVTRYSTVRLFLALSAKLKCKRDSTMFPMRFFTITLTKTSGSRHLKLKVLSTTHRKAKSGSLLKAIMV